MKKRRFDYRVAFYATLVVLIIVVVLLLILLDSSVCRFGNYDHLLCPWIS